MTQWQPIETAPKDGAWILLNGGGLRQQRHWVEDFGRRPVVAMWDDKEEKNGLNGWGDWFVCDFDDGYGSGLYYEDPTHWMPLQAPPVADGESESKNG